jgi:hypothetical protein
VGSEKQSDDEVAKNIIFAYEQIISHCLRKRRTSRAFILKQQWALL